MMGEALYQKIIEVYPQMSNSRDIRLFNTLARYLNKAGKDVTVTPRGLAMFTFGSTSLKHVTFSDVIDVALSVNKNAQKAPESSFETMCLEEDEEELSCMRELYKKLGAKNMMARFNMCNFDPQPATEIEDDCSHWAQEARKRTLPHAAGQREDVPVYMLF